MKYRNFKLFFYGQSISLIGTWMQKTAVAWLVYRLTGSALLLGLTGFVGLIPSLILSPYAGSLIDRYNRYHIMVICQLISMLQAGALALLILFNHYNITAIICLSLLAGIVNAFDSTCRQSLMVDMVDDPQDLPNAIALNSTMTNFARIAGPAVAGLVLGQFGEDVCFFGNFFSYGPVLICIFMMKLNLAERKKATQGTWESLREGYIYVRSNPDIRSLIILLSVSSLLVMPFGTLIPIFAKDIFNGDANTFSWFEIAAGLGSVFSAVYLANLKSDKVLLPLIITSSIIFGISVLFVAYSKNLASSLFFMAISGAGMMAQSAAINTYLQTHTTLDMRARVISYYIMAYQGVMPIGSLLVGWMAGLIGTRVTVGVEGIMGILAAIVYLLHQKGRYQTSKDLSGYAQPVNLLNYTSQKIIRACWIRTSFRKKWDVNLKSNDKIKNT
ncbi:MFS transporter [Pedobacter jeongneungensis]|uniref:MFS transporter n=1 Tax=Pedobacter jeongneungensis TaxID=947309 RepID=UPI001F062DC4|nr:MFS transporter [Pedobacter jeongneungensis]